MQARLSSALHSLALKALAPNGCADLQRLDALKKLTGFKRSYEMLKAVTTLTKQALMAEIEKVLDNYHYYPYQKAFTTPDLRQELITYALNRIPCVDSNIDEQKVFSLDYGFPSLCWEQQLHLANLIHQGICFILQEKPELVSHHLPRTV